MKQNKRRWLATAWSIGLVMLLSTPALSQEVPRITKEELKEMLGKPDVVVLDVRTDLDWMASARKIKGAVREDPEKVDSWMGKYDKGKTLVFYCA